MSHQLWRSLISVLLIAGLIIPTSIWSAPSVVAAPLTAAQPQTRSLGQIIFAPAIDADGDSATNPIESAPVPIAQLPDRALGIVAIAAQLQATDARTRLLNTPVTLRIWQSDRLIHDQTYRTDEWGAIVIRVPVTDIAGEFRYQATASGYGETAMRLFRFDPTLPTITLRGDGAQLTTQLTSNGQVRLTLNTSFDLQADRDEATVQLARQPRDVPAQAAALVKSDHAVWLPFPEVKLNLVDAHTAQIDLQLPPGAYRAVGAVTINAAQAVHSLAQP